MQMPQSLQSRDDPGGEDAAPDEPYQTLSSRTIWRSPWYALREDRVRFPDGSEGQYTVVEKAASVYVVPVTHDGQLVLIRNYRYPLGRWLWEVPAGGVLPGAAFDEMAHRELLEEAGGQAESLEKVAEFYTMPGIGTESAHVFLARGVTLGKPQPEAGEAMERHLLPVEDVLRMAASGEIEDGLSALAILLCAPRLQMSKKSGEDRNLTGA